MKREILKILLMKWKSSPQAAEEITDHIFEFIEWMVENISFIQKWSNTEPVQKIIYYYHKENEYTLEELYQYWLKEVKK